MNTHKLLLRLSKQFPKRFAKMNHDRVGLMCGKLPSEVHKILLCLDFDDEVYPTVLKEKPDLVLTHHPFIYGTRGYVLAHDPVKKALVEKMEALGVPVYSMHTNFDTGEGGMNDALSEALGLKNISHVEGEIMMRGGTLPKAMKAEEFARYAKEKLNVDYALLINEGKPVVETVAIVGGGGSRDWKVARDAGYDIYVSGDVSHHVRRDIVLNHYNYLDMPHEIEKIFIPQMKKILLSIDVNLQIVTVDHEKLPKLIY